MTNNSLTHIKQATLIVMCIMNLVYMHYTIITTNSPEYPLDGTSSIDNITGIFIDIFIVFFITSLLTLGKFKPTIATTFIVTYLWSFCNILYSRFFNSYLTISAIGQGTSLFDPLVFNAVVCGFKWQDLFFIIELIFFILIYKKTKTAGTYRTIITLCLSALLLILFDMTAHFIYCYSIPECRYYSYYKKRIISRHFDEHGRLCEPIITTFHRSSLRTLYYDIVEDFNGKKELSGSQKASIAEAVKESSKSMIPFSDSVNYNKNIIFIIVESYMSFSSDMKVKGKEITPFLNSLRHDSSTYYNGHMAPNITLGESSDGQYIYMTGLLPLKSAITVSKAKNKVLPGMPKLLEKLGFKSRMIIPTQPSLWNQSIMCQQYGFHQLFSAKDYGDKTQQELNDHEVFELASKIDNQNKCKKTFSVILTVSMHYPYTEPIDKSFKLEDSNLSTELKNYLIACHYTDKCIHDYINHLKTSGLYDKSLIIITADHHVHSTDFGSGISNELPLYIINSGIDNQKSWHGPCNQIDVYTTLMNILNIETEWCGLGHSLLSPNYQSSLNDSKWDISEWVLRNNYFNK